MVLVIVAKLRTVEVLVGQTMQEQCADVVPSGVTLKKEKAMAVGQLTASNYSAWAVQPRGSIAGLSSEEILRHLAEFGVLSASGHNTQPWRLRIDEGGALLITSIPGRELVYGGVTGAEPHVSIGTFIETLVLAAEGYGLALSVTYEAGEARVSVGSVIRPDDLLHQAIVARHSDRSEYATSPIEAEVLAGLIEGDELLGADVMFVTDRAGIDFVATETSVATREIMSDRTFREELSHWVRNNMTKQFDGMPGFTQGMPTPPSFVGPMVIRNINIGKQQAKTDSQRVSQSAALAILRAKTSEPSSMLSVGRLYTRICVQARAKGLATSAVASSVIGVGSSGRIRERFAIADTPVTVVRLGISTEEARPSPRRLPADLFL